MHIDNKQMPVPSTETRLDPVLAGGRESRNGRLDRHIMNPRITALLDERSTESTVSTELTMWVRFKQLREHIWHRANCMPCLQHVPHDLKLSDLEQVMDRVFSSHLAGPLCDFTLCNMVEASVQALAQRWREVYTAPPATPYATCANVPAAVSSVKQGPLELPLR